MRVIGVLVLVLWVVGVVNGVEDKTSVEVVDLGECTDCALNNINSSHAFSDLRVSVDCMSASGQLKRRGVAQVDEQGQFKVTIPSYLVNKDGELKEDCYAQLHRSSKPCSIQDSIESARIVSKSNGGGKHVFGPVSELKFTQLACASFDLFAELFGKPFPLPPCPPISKKRLPPPAPIYEPPLPPVPVYKKPLPPPVPIYKKPLPPPVPVYKPPVPMYRPPVPIYKKPLSPPVPIFKKPCPPPVPIYKKPLPPPVVYKKPRPPVHKKPLPPPEPIYKPPVYKKPLPPPVPVYKPPTAEVKPLPPPTPEVKPLPPPVPFYKPLPPFPTLPPKPPCPPLPTLPPFPIPPKYWKHPFLGKLPPLPPQA